MATRGEQTRARILDAARASVLERGFAATSIDDIQEAAGISRGTFFYHFPSKDDVSREIIERHAEVDREVTDEFLRRAGDLVDDPAQQLVVMVGLYADYFRSLDTQYPGCLFASYTYEAGLFDEATEQTVKDSIAYWRDVVAAKVREAMEAHTPVIEIDPVGVADQIYSVMQGAFILGKVDGSNELIAEQMNLLKEHLKLVFGLRTAAKEVPAAT